MRAITILSLCIAAAAMLPAQTYVPFTQIDGGNPSSAPIQTPGGALLGATVTYGLFNAGTIYSVTPKGIAPFHQFYCVQYSYCPEGRPDGDFVVAADGTIYGTGTLPSATMAEDAFGTVYRITSDGVFTVINKFPARQDGVSVFGSLIQAANRDFYGVSYVGGANHAGTIIRMTADGVVTPLHSFCNDNTCPSPQTITGGLVEAANGDLYGLTRSNVSPGNGTIYKLTPDGQYTTIYTFCPERDCPDGDTPVGSLIEAADGNLYGATRGAGTFHNRSAIFRVSADDEVSVLYTFPESFGQTLQLIAGSDGNVYGAAIGGTIYRITLDGDPTVLYKFPSSIGPPAALGQYTDGTLFAVTFAGPNDIGALVFLNAGLPAFVKAQPGTGGAGSSVTILGTGLAGATSVTFGGAPAVFTVTSDFAISATVPAGATNGAVQVVTPKGTLSTDIPFFIL